MACLYDKVIHLSTYLTVDFPSEMYHKYIADLVLPPELL